MFFDIIYVLKIKKRKKTLKTSEIAKITIEELTKWNLLSKGWKLSMIQATSYAGRCDPKKKEIQISEPISKIETDAFTIETIKHEIAHALAGCHNQHNHVWKRWAIKVGCIPKATYKSTEAQDDLRLAKTKYVMCFGDLIVKSYLRKPNKKTISNIGNYWAVGHKARTNGKLEIKVYNPATHKEFI